MKRGKFIYSNILAKNLNKTIDNSLLTKIKVLNTTASELNPTSNNTLTTINNENVIKKSNY